MVKFDLVPDLRVSRVSWDAKPLAFIQENRKRDGSFYLEFPERLEKDRAYQVSFEYAGPMRRIWYPTPAGQPSRATYDLQFRVPHGSTLVSTGKLVSQTRQGGFDVSQWSSEAPIPQAVFRYFGLIYTKSTTDEATHTQLSAYVLPGPSTGAAVEAPPPGPTARGPGAAAGASAAHRPAPSGAPVQASLQPNSPGDVLIDAGNSVRIFHAWFGPSAYDSLAVVQGGGADSFPGLIYASTWVMAGYGKIAARFETDCPGGIPCNSVWLTTGKAYVDEDFAREVSRQWWGNTVGVASFHDAWLSTGFSNFSASIYDQVARPADFADHWTLARQAILSRPDDPDFMSSLLHPPRPAPYLSDIRPNDAGPLWMGLLNDSNATPDVGNIVGAAKGGYILHMLRSMMWDPTTGDNDFRAMMQDFVKQFTNRAASTEDFQSVVEKHIKPAMDLDGNGSMNWFFQEWVYGTDVPSYRLEYSLTPYEGGKGLLSGKLTQSGVSPEFAMPVPLFAEVGGKEMRVTPIVVRGNSTAEFELILSELPERILMNAHREVLSDREEVKQVKQ